MEETRSLDELSRELDELRASRARVVMTADADRRGIERGLHDGVQQDLVALAVNLQLARELADSDPAALKAHLEEIAQDVRDALESVRALAHDVYPSLLVDRGLVEALRGAAPRVGFPTRVEAAGERYPPEIEAAAYFCCVEALDAVGWATPGVQATVGIRQEDSTLVFDVVIDGVPRRDEPDLGATLTTANDRLGAVGGRLSVSSEEGRTRVVGTIPLES